MSSGALTPARAVRLLADDGHHHLHEPLQLAFLKNVAGGLIMSFAGIFSMSVCGKLPDLSSSNPGFVKLLQGMLFSVGLVFIYFTGAEVYTGYPMWFVFTLLDPNNSANSEESNGGGRSQPLRSSISFSFILKHLRALLNALIGNLLGTLLGSSLFAIASDALTSSPSREYVIEKLTTTAIDQQWHVTFIRAIACGYLVTFAMLLGTQNFDGISKAMGLWLPFVVATTSEFPHTVEYMNLGITGMMLGANIGIGGFLGKCVVPDVLGNTIGGAVFTGLYHWWVFIKCNNGEEQGKKDVPNTIGEYLDGEDDNG